MAAISHVLFPYDFSNQALLAARFVGAVASRFSAKITVLSIVPPIWDEPIGGVTLAAGNAREFEEAMRARLNAVALPELAGLCVQRHVESGDPALKIVEFAERTGLDLIMMPTHGTSLFRSMLIGSVTGKVLHDARCPVWTATHAKEQKSRDIPKTILCAVDGSPRSAEVIRWAADFSQHLGAALRLIHVVPPISDWLALPTEQELQEQVRDAGRVNIEALQKTAGVDAPLRVGVGQFVNAVTEEARQEDADLVLIGRGSLQSTFGRLRTHAYGIIQRSPCPVLSV